MNATKHIQIPEEVERDQNLSDFSKLLFGRILLLSHKEKYCWATNNYFAEHYSCSPSKIKRALKQLVVHNYLLPEFDFSNSNNTKRIIKIASKQVVKNEPVSGCIIEPTSRFISEQEVGSDLHHIVDEVSKQEDSIQEEYLFKTTMVLQEPMELTIDTFYQETQTKTNNSMEEENSEDVVMEIESPKKFNEKFVYPKKAQDVLYYTKSKGATLPFEEITSIKDKLLESGGYYKDGSEMTSWQEAVDKWLNAKDKTQKIDSSIREKDVPVPQEILLPN